MHTRSCIKAIGSPQRWKYITANGISGGQQPSPIGAVTCGAVLFKHALTRFNVRRPVGRLKGGWLMRFALACSGSCVPVAQGSDIRRHRDHFGAVLGQSAAIHTALHAFVDAVLDGSRGSGAAREPRIVSKRRRQSQGPRLSSRA